MIKDKIKKSLSLKIKDNTLVDSFVNSYNKIIYNYLNNDPQSQLQNVGLFVESTLRISELFVFGSCTSIGKNLKIDDCIDSLAKASGNQNFRIHIPRMCRCIYDFRTRKSSVHLKDVSPEQIDSQFVYNTVVWIVIEVVYQCDSSSSKSTISSLLQIKYPVVQNLDGKLLTNIPQLTGPERILILLNSNTKMSTEDLYFGSSPKIKSKSHLRLTLKRLEEQEFIYNNSDLTWSLRMPGNKKVIEILKRYC